MNWNYSLSFSVAVLLLSSSSMAQNRATSVANRLRQLSARVEEVAKDVAAGSESAAALKSLRERLATLESQLGAGKKQREAAERLQAKLTDAQERLEELELRVATMGLQLASAERGAVGYNNGFFIRSADNKYLLRLRGLLQAGYHGRVHTRDRDELQESGLGEDLSTFAVRTARVYFDGHVFNSRLSYRIAYDFASSSILDAFGDLRLLRGLRFRIGRGKTPMGRQQLVSRSSRQFIDVSPALNAFVAGRDLGALFYGDLLRRDMLQYQLGVFNGAGEHATADDNTDFLYLARLVFSPWGPVPMFEGDRAHGDFRLSLGASFSFNLSPTDLAVREGLSDPQRISERNDLDGDGHVDNVAIYTAALELAARYQGLFWQAEFFFRHEDPGKLLDARRFWGLYNQVGYYYQRADLDFALRYSYWEPPDYGVDRTLFRASGGHQFDVVLSGMPWGPFIKWQVQYSRRWMRDIEAVRSTGVESVHPLGFHEIQLQLQLAFR
ncbi:MAG: hypothetical protein H6707_08525 [Deltaproteobacteria bacterium]|nr:hypothetical protein [Deltaproteobacteria bacterium]